MIAVPETVVGCTYREGPWNHTGVVLALDDVRAWTGTLAFFGPDGYVPPAEQVTAHVEECLRTVPGFARKVPVLWSFGRVYWERLEALYPLGEKP